MLRRQSPANLRTMTAGSSSFEMNHSSDAAAATIVHENGSGRKGAAAAVVDGDASSVAVHEIGRNGSSSSRRATSAVANSESSGSGGKMDQVMRGLKSAGVDGDHLREIWRSEAKGVLGSTMASVYATLLICLYVAFSFTELVRFPNNKDYLEIYGFFTYLYLVATSYLLYIVCYVVKGQKEQAQVEALRYVENPKSHGSVTVRIGVLVFGVGALIYYLLELLRFAELLSKQGPCFHPAIGLNDVLALVFTSLQAYVIFTYPRLNIQCHKLLNRFGTMHLFALNIIMWFRTLIRESIEEIVEFEEKESKLKHQETACHSLLDMLHKAEEEREICNEYRHDILGDVAVAAVPYLYPFMIEFALIGASVALIMSKHIGKPKNWHLMSRVMRKPQPKVFMRKTDWSHSSKGLTVGLMVLAAAVVNLSLFFGLDGHEHSKDEAELLSKISNTVMNAVGIVACLIGIAHIQKLADDKEGDDDDDEEEESFDLDEALLRFGSVFSFLYAIFTIITGSFSDHIEDKVDEDFPQQLHTLNGLVEIIQIVLQIIFIHNLKAKELPEHLKEERPGRQITIFLFLFNVSQWLVYTFEIQKVRASLVEAAFYGFMPWVIIRRVTLPLAVFFRFHSSVVSIELWKEIYYVDRDEGRSNNTNPMPVIKKSKIEIEA